MLTFQALAAMARDALGVGADQSIAEGYSVKDVINLAGRWLTASHQWGWLDQAITTVDFVSGQEYVALPADFRSLGTVTISNSLAQRVRVSSMDVIVRYRTGLVIDSNDYLVAISYRPTTEGAREAVLEVYPTPTAARSDAMTLYYSAGWGGMVEGGVAPVPSFMEPLVVEAVRSYAQGLAEEGQAGVSVRMEALQSGAFYRAFQRQDGQVQDEYGPMLNTSGSQYNYYDGPPSSVPYPNPS